MTTKTLHIIKLLLLLFGLLISGAAYAQTPEKIADKEEGDPFEMGLENMMKLTLNRSSIVGFGYAHNKGEYQFEYQRDKTFLVDNYLDDVIIGDNDLIKSYDLGNGLSSMKTIPGELNVEDHRFRFMYAPWEETSMSVEAAWRWNGMNVVPTDTAYIPFQVSSKSFTDTRIMVNMEMMDKNLTIILLNVGVSVPTGSINKFSSTSFSDDVKLGYIMQMGSGTLDPIIEGVYMRAGAKTSWGIKAKMINRIFDNKFDYRVGHEFKAIAGIGHIWFDGFGTTLRVGFNTWSQVIGEDGEMSMIFSPTSNAQNTGGMRLDGSVGLVFEMPKNGIKGISFIADFRYPIYQNLNGPQLGVGNQFVLTVKYTGGDNKL